MKTSKTLVIGACGQLGMAVTAALRVRYGCANVIAADILPAADLRLDVLDERALLNIVGAHGITQVYLLTGTHPPAGEKQEHASWELNVRGLLSVLEVARAGKLDKVFWPSSTEVFGPGAPMYGCPQHTRPAPRTVHGMSKLTGEHWCSHYFDHYGVDTRSVRLPGLIAHNSGGITAYAAGMFHCALRGLPYTCYLAEDTCLPAIYLQDAARAAMELMEAPREQISVRTSYNLAAMSFAPCDLAAAIKEHIPGFITSYKPDHRDTIAAAHPASIDDTQARKDWGWCPRYDLSGMAKDLLAYPGRIIPLPEKPACATDYPDFQIDNYAFTNARQV